MTRHNINQAIVDARWIALTEPSSGGRSTGRQDQARQEIVRRTLTFTGVHAPMWLRAAAWTAAGYGEVRCVQFGRTGPITLTLIGYEANVDVLMVLFASLQQQSLNALKAWWKSYPGKERQTSGQRFRDRRQFMESYFFRVHKQLERERAQATASAGSGAELVLADRSRAIAVWMDEHYPHLGRARASRRKGGSAAAAAAGQAAGARAATGRTASLDTKRALTS